MRREAKLLLGTVLLGGVLSIGASTSTSIHPGQYESNGRDDAPSGVQSCQFTTNDVFDTNWNQGSISTSNPLSISNLNYPISDSGVTNTNPYGTRLSESDYEPGDYFALALNADSSTYALDLNNPDGSLKQVVDATGTVQYIGANYLFYVGDAWPGGNGTILTASPSLSLGIFGSASLPVNVVNPSTSALDNAFACASGSPGIPVVTEAVSSDGSVTLSWTPPPSQGSSAVTGYVVYANDLTDPSQNDSQPITDLTMNGDTYTASILGLFDGDTYTFSVAAENPQGIGSFSDPSSPLAIPGASADDPFGLSVSQGSEYFAVTWNYPSDDADSVANYKVVGLDQTDYANDVTDVCPNQGSESLSQTCDVPGVTAGDTYIFFVEALDENGEVSGVSSASPPSIALASPFDDPVAVSADSTNTWFANYVGGPHATGSVTMVNDVSNAVTEIDSTDFVEP